jgi:aspartyl-tRNA(Asn)/glutamyl-tRNA(Gln) amidotransferase subunit A
MDMGCYADARLALERNETSCESLVLSFLAVIERDNSELNAFLHVEEDSALERARELDLEIAGGEFRPLTGLILGVKDVICVKGETTTCGSRMLKDFVSLYSATSVERLVDAGAIVIGKLNCDEFAMGSSNENSHFGPVKNPANTAYVPGGSSGGSVAAVAAGMCHVALGTDTGGSVRQPAAFTGVVGLKPTYGRVSRFGLVAYASSFDVIGPVGTTVQDCAAVLSVMAGHDPRDSTSAPVDVPDFDVDPSGDLSGVVIGLPADYFGDGLDSGIRAMLEARIDALAARGAEFKNIELPHTRYGIATYYILATAEASSNLARYDGVRYGHRADEATVRSLVEAEAATLESTLQVATEQSDDVAIADAKKALDQLDSPLQRLYSQTRAEGFGPEVRRRIMLGTYVLSSGYYDAYYDRAQRVRRLISDDFTKAFEEVDVILTPATPTPAFKLGDKVDDPLAMYLNDVYTVTANLAGIPGLVVPIGTHGDPPHLPVGLQLLGKPFSEPLLLRVGGEVMDGSDKELTVNGV